ncbi:monofunctional biosynthetic peptidoglycan transglycosylase [Denitratisoma sp. DHT3]|uniref:monofunctional biosynthetic peptidoglycan transglycosylase n=1 Tax=Denitratisoma sp. DHT3 TaxID=1981880 RepID=UPI001198A72E|nr:monofunctional biosynthetic peptidoglycan transglycosylase [Denitratisoma sp. DHT3]QDX81774.1 monofunctional biosynthetic peptidoglycan transglycosylase [Denitratisoma sp. DHT3]
MTRALIHRLKQGLALALLALLLWQGWYLGWVVWWKFVDPGSTAFMRQRLVELREKNPQVELKHFWVPYARISNHLKRAVVAAEDDRFVDHEGFDWEGMQKALEKNQKKGRVVAGGSTISQQLAKNLFLSGAKTPWRKAQEAVITVMIEACWDKRRILEVYLNSVEWGEGVFGAEAAARRYYRSSAAHLGAEQAARLAVMLPAPRRFEKNPYSAYVNGRTQLILGRMAGSEVP